MAKSTIDKVKTMVGAPPPSKKRSMKNMAFTAIKAIVSAVLIYYILSKTNLSEIWVSVKSADPWILLLSFSLHAVGYYASAYRWRVLALAQKMDMPVSYLVESYAVAMFFNNILPTTIGGDAVRAYDSWRKGFSKLKSIATVGVERFIGLFALVVFANRPINRSTPTVAMDFQN